MLDQAQNRLASSAVRELRVALSNFFLYSAGNDMVLKSIERLLGALDLLFESLPSVGLGESEGRLLMEGSALDERMTGSTNMIKDLFLTHKIQTLTFLKGVTAQEIKDIFELLKPRALPTGLSLVQALVQKPLAHIRLNEKVYVAIKEGEKVVTGDAKTTGEENMEEALEALQYFLQIFSRVRPESKKREVARKMIDNMGEWLTEGMGGSGSAAGTPVAPGDSKSWLEVMGGFMALKKNLAATDKPAQIKEAQADMDELIKKLVLLGESQGLPLGEAVAAAGEAALISAPKVSSPEIPSGAGQILADIREGKWDAFWDLAREEEANDCLSQLQDPEEEETFETLWEGLWHRIFAGEEPTQGLALRHLNRLEWNRVPRHLQLDGFRNVRKFLVAPRHPSNYPWGLSLLQDWLPQEIAYPDWEEFLDTVLVLKELAENTKPRFERQNQAAAVALETVFCDPILESLFTLHSTNEKEKELVLNLFTTLGSLAVPFLIEKAEKAQAGGPDGPKAVELLNSIESSGVPVYLPFLKEKGKPENIDKLLEIFRKAPLPAGLADHFEKNWAFYSPEVQIKIVDIVELWKRTDFRPLLIHLLVNPGSALSFRALKALAKVGLEGDAGPILEAVQKYPAHSHDREKFWILACQVLGELGDAMAIPSLMEWAEKYKFLEHKKERSPEVRKVAIEALGHFASADVKGFLEGLRKEGEKEFKPAVDKALASLGAKQEKP
jgi:hypothetical protein